MLKFLSLIITGLCVSMSANAQFANTSWSGMANVPQPISVNLQFSKDTLALIDAESGDFVIETMTYRHSGDTLWITKVQGGSPCGEGSTGLYRFQVNDDKLSVLPISDPCSERAEAFTLDPYIRKKP